MVPPQQKDPSTKDQAIVQDGDIRSYHGAPLINEDGYELGTFCMLDTQPRELTDEQNHQLEIVANGAMDKLELHRTKNRLEDSNQTKQVVLKEIHHRVKNNVQVTMALINMEKRRIMDPEMVKKFNNLKNRIGSLDSQ